MTYESSSVLCHGLGAVRGARAPQGHAPHRPGYIQGYGLKSGSSQPVFRMTRTNIIVNGTNPADMAFAANYIVEHHGGIVVVEKWDK